MQQTKAPVLDIANKANIAKMPFTTIYTCLSLQVCIFHEKQYYKIFVNKIEISLSAYNAVSSKTS